MRKEIYYAKINYEWRVVRTVKGVEKPAKNWNKASVTTTTTDINVEDLNNNEFYMKRLRHKHKSSHDIQVRVTSIENPKYLCMSNDVY